MVKKVLTFLAVIFCIAAMSVIGSVCVKASSISDGDYPYVGTKKTCQQDGGDCATYEDDYPYVGTKKTAAEEKKAVD